MTGIEERIKYSIDVLGEDAAVFNNYSVLLIFNDVFYFFNPVSQIPICLSFFTIQCPKPDLREIFTIQFRKSRFALDFYYPVSQTLIYVRFLLSSFANPDLREIFTIQFRKSRFA
jgi:hypothetical protein